MNSFAHSPNVLLLIYCSLILVASLSGGWILLAMHLTHTRLQTAVSFVAGLMLGMALLHFLPHAIHQNHSLDETMQCVLGGFLVMFFLQRFFPHHHHDVSDQNSDNSNLSARTARGANHEHRLQDAHSWQPAGQLSWSATAVGMAFHSLLGGVALAAAVAAAAGTLGPTVGLGTALVIILHKPFDAMTVSTLMAASGCSRASRHVLNVLFALVTPVGALLFYAGANHFFGANSVFLGSALAFCAGTFLCISCADLLPELQFHSHDRLKLSIALAGGLLIAILIGQLEPADHDHHQALAASGFDARAIRRKTSAECFHLCQWCCLIA